MWKISVHNFAFQLRNATLNVFLILTQFGLLQTNGFSLQAFDDFLTLNHLSHGIIASTNPLQIFDSSHLMDLTSKYHIRFYDLNRNETTDFGEYLYYSSRRVGIYVPQVGVGFQHSMSTPQTAVGDFFNNSQAWLFEVEAAKTKDDWSELRFIFEFLQINVDADVTLVVPERDCTYLYNVFDLYKICHACDTPLIIAPKGSWCPTTGFQLLSEFQMSFVQRRRNLGNITLKVATVLLEKPENMTVLEFLSDQQNNKQLDAMQRKIYNSLKLLQPLWHTNFALRVEKNWTSVMNLLEHKEIELSVTTTRLIPQRVHLIDYSAKLQTEYFAFLFRHPRRNSIRNIFFEPFAEVVWWCVLGIVALATLQLVAHVRHESKRQQLQSIEHKSVPQLEQQQQEQGQAQGREQQPTAQSHQHQLERHFSEGLENRLDFIALLILNAMFMQGPSPDAFNCTSTRLLIITTCVFSVMLLQFYSGFIVGSLLTPQPRTITTLPALYNSSLQIGMEAVPYNHEFMLTSELLRATYEQRICKKPHNNVLPMQAGMQRVAHGGFAFFTTADRAYRLLQPKLTDSEYCELQAISGVRPMDMYCGMRKDSPFREHIKYAVLYFITTGLVDYSNKVWEVPTLDCEQFNTNQEVEVDLEHFAPALMLLAVGMVISLLVLLLECVYWRALALKYRGGVGVLY